jgi:hypothetical protein
MLAVGECPAKLAAIGALGQPPRRAKELEDLATPAVLARDRHRPRNPPDRVLGDHLEQSARLAAAEGVEDAADVLDGSYFSSGAIVSP